MATTNFKSRFCAGHQISPIAVWDNHWQSVNPACVMSVVFAPFGFGCESAKGRDKRTGTRLGGEDEYHW